MAGNDARRSSALHCQQHLSSSLSRVQSILRRPHHEIHFDAIAEAEYHSRFELRDVLDIDEPISTILEETHRFPRINKTGYCDSQFDLSTRKSKNLAILNILTGNI